MVSALYNIYIYIYIYIYLFIYLFILFQGTNGATRKKAIEQYEQQLKNLCFPVEFRRESAYVPSFEERYPFKPLKIRTLKKSCLVPNIYDK